jgi:hypothetical protein
VGEIGATPDGRNVGAPTQMAVFTRAGEAPTAPSAAAATAATPEAPALEPAPAEDAS